MLFIAFLASFSATTTAALTQSPLFVKLTCSSPGSTYSFINMISSTESSLVSQITHIFQAEGKATFSWPLLSKLTGKGQCCFLYISAMTRHKETPDQGQVTLGCTVHFGLVT